MAKTELSFITEELRATISKRLESLNVGIGRTQDWYSNSAEGMRIEKASETLHANAELLNVERSEWMDDAAEQLWTRSDVERLTPWEFRSTRQRYDSHVAELTQLVRKAGMEVPPVIMVEGPTGRIDAQIELNKPSGVSVVYVEEGILDFGLEMLKIVVSSLAIPRDPNELVVDASAANQIIEANAGRGQLLRLFEVICRYLIGEVVTPLERYPVHRFNRP
jgi:hypothetical protein